MTDPGVHRHLPGDLRDADVVEVEVVGEYEVRVVHRDGASAVHVFQAPELNGIAEPLRNPAVFATAAVIDGTLAWDVGGGLVYDRGAEMLWLHAHGFCDGTHDLTRQVEQ